LSGDWSQRARNCQTGVTLPRTQTSARPVSTSPARGRRCSLKSSDSSAALPSDLSPWSRTPPCQKVRSLSHGPRQDPSCGHVNPEATPHGPCQRSRPLARRWRPLGGGGEPRGCTIPEAALRQTACARTTSPLASSLRTEGLAMLQATSPVEVRRTIARRILNMGCLSAQELIVRLACRHGSPATNTAAAIRKLRRAACEGLTKVQTPHPFSTAPTIRRWDIVYVRPGTALLGLVGV
jgi:hypothetical protein